MKRATHHNNLTQLREEHGVCRSGNDHRFRASTPAEPLLAVLRTDVTCEVCGYRGSLPFGPLMRSALKAGLIVRPT